MYKICLQLTWVIMQWWLRNEMMDWLDLGLDCHKKLLVSWTTSNAEIVWPHCEQFPPTYNFPWAHEQHIKAITVRLVNQKEREGEGEKRKEREREITTSMENEEWSELEAQWVLSS